ncbi:MAG: serine/threonine-protein kinase [Gemmatimonadaceae bacterium]
MTSSLSGTYTLERELGGGGMSRVFLAEENRLRRKVVVKVLSPELAAGISAERFEREIQLAASLQQANIVPVLSTGESGGLPYYTMPFVEGESLRARLMRGGVIDAAEVTGILRDVARALSYAHERGVVHRDIKPDNVLLSGGAAVVTDFGIAKAIAAARGEAAGATLTQFGTSIGTPAYMAPEQAAGDPNVDHRADIYALGCMAYELLCGHPPFHGRTPQRMLAAHMGEAPAPLLEVAPMVSPALATVVMLSLEKDPAARPQSARELVKVLDSIASGTSHETLHASLLARPGLLKWALAIYAVAFIVVAVISKAAIVGIGLPDWVLPGAMIVMGLGLPVLLFTGYAQSAVRRVALATPTLTPGGGHAAHGTLATIAVKASPHLTWRRSAIGGGLALAAFVVVIGTFMVLRASGIGPFGTLLAAGKLGDARLLIGDFRATSTDSALGNVVAEAVRAGLSQSNRLSLIAPSVITAELRRMQRPPETKLDPQTAREVAIRSGIPAFVTGEITGLGTGFVVSVRLVGSDSGQTLASFSEAADSPKDLIPTIDKITRQLRSKAGESLKHLQSSPPLFDVMTPSLDALRKYTEGLVAFRAGENAKSLRLMDEAIAIDSNFAAAYRSAAVALGNSGGDRDRELRYTRKAFELSDRLPDAERYQTRAVYFSRVDFRKAIPEYEAAIRARPSYTAGMNNIAVLQWQLRDLKGAEQHLRRASILDSSSAFPIANLGATLLAQGDLRGADSVLQIAERRHPGHIMTEALHANSFWARREIDSLVIRANAYLKVPRDPGAVAFATSATADAYKIAGRLKEAERAYSTVLTAEQAAGVPAATLNHALGAAGIEGWYRGNKAGARRMLDKAVADFGSLPRANRNYDYLALTYAALGDPVKARAMMAEFQQHRPYVDDDAKQFEQLALSMIAYAEGRYDDGVREARAGDVGACDACADALIGMNQDLAGRPDSAITAYRRYVESTNPMGRMGIDGILLTGSYKRLGELLEAKGQTAEALKYYEHALRLWRRADPELAPQVAQLRRAVDRLRKTGG